MNDSVRFQRVTGISAILLTSMTIGNVITLFTSVKNNTNAFTDPALLLSVGAQGANLFHWSMVFDIFAYLTFVPVALFCWFWFKTKDKGMVLLFTFCGLAYAFIGSIGAVILGAVVPKMINDYALASTTQQGQLKILVDTFYWAISHGLWNPLEILFISVWFFGIGSLLRYERQALGIFSMVIGCFAILDPLGWILNNDLIFNIGVAGMLLMLIWSIWFGIDLLHRPVVFSE